MLAPAEQHEPIVDGPTPPSTSISVLKSLEDNFVVIHGFNVEAMFTF